MCLSLVALPSGSISNGCCTSLASAVPLPCCGAKGGPRDCRSPHRRLSAGRGGARTRAGRRRAGAPGGAPGPPPPPPPPRLAAGAGRRAPPRLASSSSSSSPLFGLAMGFLPSPLGEATDRQVLRAGKLSSSSN